MNYTIQTAIIDVCSVKLARKQILTLNWIDDDCVDDHDVDGDDDDDFAASIG